MPVVNNEERKVKNLLSRDENVIIPAVCHVAYNYCHMLLG